MLVSYQWLQTFFDTPLPPPEIVAEALTFHSSEVESTEVVGTDTIFDVNILPDNAAWLLSHRGVAKEVSVILNIPLANDVLQVSGPGLPSVDQLHITVDSPVCDHYSATLIEGVTVGPSPKWLVARLEALGQKSINNIVDITNYVMLATGQPLHAFSASALAQADGYAVGVRQARVDEPFVSLTGEEYRLTPEDTVITDGSDAVIALAGVKGGLQSGVNSETTSLILEAAHFERTSVRRTAQRHKLPTDAAKRFENGIARALISPSVALAATLITEIAGGTVVGSTAVGKDVEVRSPVSVTVSQINSILGLSLTVSDVIAILERFGYDYTVAEDVVSVVPPPERDDVVIPADLIEEVGRIHGLDAIVSIPPQAATTPRLNKRHYYAEVIRQTLTARGFSEVYTSSFRNQDEVKIVNALASDKSYLRSTLVENVRDARTKNLPYRDLLGVSAICVFEIGTVFATDREEFRVGLAVQTNTNYKSKIDDPLWQEAIADIEAVLGTSVPVTKAGEGIVEFSLDALLTALPMPTGYLSPATAAGVTYQTFSVYPPVSRDIAMWVDGGVVTDDVQAVLRAAAGEELVRVTHLDTFTKEGRTSLAFRLVFQSHEKTFDGSEVDALMASVYDAVAKAGWEVR